MQEIGSSAGGDPHELIENAIQLTRKGKYEDAIGVFEAHLENLSGGDLSDKRLAAGAFSFYGLCVAMVRRRYGEAVQYCKVSLKSNSFEPDHRYNLALIYLERDDRRRAVEILKEGLELNPRHGAINRTFREIGRRRPPSIPFLHRDNPLNVWLGKRRPKNMAT